MSYSRTQELRKSGARDRTGGGGGAFVAWPKSGHAWVEGCVIKLWEGQYGKAVTIEVTARSDGLEARSKDESGESHQEIVARGADLNIGLNYAALEGTVRDDDMGKVMHFAFEGWADSRSGGNSYRKFTVLEVPDPATDRLYDETGTDPAADGGAADDPDDDLPF